MSTYQFLINSNIKSEMVLLLSRIRVIKDLSFSITKTLFISHKQEVSCGVKLLLCNLNKDKVFISLGS